MGYPRFAVKQEGHSIAKTGRSGVPFHKFTEMRRACGWHTGFRLQNVLQMIAYVVTCGLDGCDLLRVVVGNFGFEFLFQGHDQLDRVQ